MKKAKNKMTLEDLAETIVNSTSQKIEKLALAVRKGFRDADKKTDLKLEKLAISVAKGFEGVDQGLDKVEATMDHQFGEVNSRLTSVERRLWALELNR